MNYTHFSQEGKSYSLFPPIEVNTELSEILTRAFELYDKCPEIRKKILHDLDAYALEKKKKRLADAAWARKQTLPLDLNALPGKSQAKVRLAEGSPRMTPEVVYMFFILEQTFHSLTDKQATERIKDSLTLQFFFYSHNYRNPPARSTRHENVRKISKATIKYILQQQLILVLEKALDDFKHLTVDSTAVWANCQWPTDSGLLRDVFYRGYHLSQQLHERFGIPNFLPWFMTTWLSKIDSLNFQINITSGKGSKEKRKKLYIKLYAVVEKASAHMFREITKRKMQKESVNLPPGKVKQLSNHWARIEGYISDSKVIMAYSRERIIEGKKIENGIKIISLSDSAAAFITKGDRETIVGYRPQLGRSENGFVSALIVPKGNAADAPKLLPLVEDSIKNTGVVPSGVSGDDGYWSTKGVDAVKVIDGVDWVSISGSKGKRHTSKEDWDSEIFKNARRMRSAVESLMFVLKDILGFGQLRRRGIEAVEIELLQKVIVYNFRQMGIVEKKIRNKERREKAKQFQAS